MRLGTGSSDGFVGELGRRSGSIGGRFLSSVAALTEMAETKVMLGDATVTSQKTFDPKQVRDYFRRIGSDLGGWSARDVSSSSDKGLGRISARFEAGAGSYLLSGHLALQFHTLLYYRPVQRVVECQKELARVIGAAEEGQRQMSDRGDKAVLERLRGAGHRDLDYQKLFEVFYDDDELREGVYSEIRRDSGEDFERLTEKKTELFAELDSLLVETHQTAPVLIDDARLATGEEGCACYFDVELVRDGSRQGLFDARKIPGRARDEICDRLDEFEAAVER